MPALTGLVNAMKTAFSECQRNDRSCLLRCALKANACFSLLSALILLFASVQISAKIGGIHANNLRNLGIGLLLYCVFLCKTARRERITSPNAWPFVLLDVAWVVASAVVILLGDLTIIGKWVVGVVADVVLAFAIMQVVGILRLKTGPGRATVTI
jgi:hypothetical protein